MCLNNLSILKGHELLAAATCFTAGPDHPKCGAACSVTGIQTEPTYPYRGVYRIRILSFECFLLFGYLA